MVRRFDRRLTGSRGAAQRRPSFFVPRCEQLEDRTAPAGLFVAGVGGPTQATAPEISLYATAGPQANKQIGIQLEAFGGTVGDTRVALGDVNGDGTDDVIAAAGIGGGSEVIIFDGANALRGVRVVLADFFVYGNDRGATQTPGFQGGVFVAAADLNGDGFAELITTPGLNGRGHLKVFDFNDGAGNFLGNNPTLRASAYTYTDYDGEIRVATMRAQGVQYIVTASGAGVAGDVRVFQDVYNMGDVPDLTMIAPSFLAARLVPFGGYAGGLSVAAGDTDGNGNDEFYVSKNDGVSQVEVYNPGSLFRAFAVGNPTPAPAATFTAFDGFLGEVRLGMADVNGDGKDEVLTTTGVSGDPNGTPIKAFSPVNGFSAPIRAFYSNPGYLAGAWLAGKDFSYSQDVTSSTTFGNGTAGTLPQDFSNGPAGDLGVIFDGSTLPAESVTGANLPFHSAEVSFAFGQFVPKDAKVSLVYVSPTAGMRSLVLYDGSSPQASNNPGALSVTITDDADEVVNGGPFGGVLTGRFLASGGSLAAFIRNLPDRNGQFVILFQDTAAGSNGTVLASPAPRLRLLY